MRNSKNIYANVENYPYGHDSDFINFEDRCLSPPRNNKLTIARGILATLVLLFVIFYWLFRKTVQCVGWFYRLISPQITKFVHQHRLIKLSS